MKSGGDRSEAHHGFKSLSNSLYDLKMPLPMLPSVSELAALETFPFPEGHQWEFKENVIDNSKLHPLICAFLNGAGGYLILGVRDVDLAIMGMPNTTTSKQIDAFMLRCDDIMHCGFVLKEDGKTISPNAVTASVVSLDSTRKIVIVRVEPETGVRYICKNGDMYIRLSASNHRFGSQNYVDSAELKHRLSIIEQRMAKEKQRDLARIQNECRGLVAVANKAVDEARGKLRVALEDTGDAKEEAAFAVKLLWEKILAEKVKAEERLEAERESGWLSCLGCF